MVPLLAVRRPAVCTVLESYLSSSTVLQKKRLGDMRSPQSPRQGPKIKESKCGPLAALLPTLQTLSTGASSPSASVSAFQGRAFPAGLNVSPPLPQVTLQPFLLNSIPHPDTLTSLLATLSPVGRRASHSLPPLPLGFQTSSRSDGLSQSFRPRLLPGCALGSRRNAHPYTP